MSEPHRPFIPRWLEDLGLPQSEFRVLVHLWSHKPGFCPSGPAIARTCRMSEDTVWNAIKALQSRGLIERKKAGRNQNTYEMIVPPVTGNQGVTQSDQSPETRGLLSPEMEGLHPPETRGRQSPETRGCIGIESKGTNSREPKKGTKRPSLTDEQFIESLKANPSFAGINIDHEIGKMQAWLLTKPGRKLTRPFMVNWLNRAETPLTVANQAPTGTTKPIRCL